VNIIVTFGNEGGLYERNQDSGRYYPSPAELFAQYDDWEVQESSVTETLSLAKDKAGNPFRNSVIRLIAKKPD
jgi:hypothetical protein